MSSIELSLIGIKEPKINYQLSPDELIEKIIETGQGEITSSGAINILTGEFTGRSPKDRFIVKDDVTKDNVWWDGDINIPFDSEKFDALYDKVINHLNNLKEIYVRDSYAGAEESYKTKIRSITETPAANLFIYNMFIRPSEDKLAEFDQVDWTIINAPTFKAKNEEDGTSNHNFSILNFSRKIVLNGGTGYTGEMKKGIFSALNFVLPVFRNTLPMHCSANIGKNGESAMFFGLSGTGKTTLSADKSRQLIGDDEHGWTADNKVFNFEGGCYAKVINLSKESEPEIYEAIKKGSLLENVKVNSDTHDVDYADCSITENTRVSYPIDYIENIATPSVGNNPKNIFFLSFDAYGVFPPIARLNPDQAAYLFISGYTSKVAGTEAGITEPQTTFSSCFGAPFMPLHPTKYAEMLSEKVQKTGVNVWLINTGWNGQKQRMSLKNTRAVINAALNGELDNVDYRKDPYFGFEVPVSIPGIEDGQLNPATSFESKEAYEKNAKILADKFKENFKRFSEFATPKLLSGGPVI